MTLGQQAFGEQNADVRIDVLNQSWRQIGVMIEMDKGDGALSIVPLSEIFGDITMRGSINGFGVRELTFSRFGDSQSPWKSALIRGMRQVRLTGFRGIPGVMASRLMFDGYIRDGSFNGLPLPSVATIQCQDKSLAYANAPLFYNLDAGSLRVRTDVILDMLAQVGIPAGVFELHGIAGVIYKAVSEAGNRRALDVLSEFLQPIGATGYWRNGVYNFKRFDTSGDPVRTLQLGDFRSISIDPPPTNTPNSVQVTTDKYAYLGPAGVRVVVETVTHWGPYTPVVATSSQNHTTGVTAAVVVVPVAGAKISETVTTTTFDGGTVTNKVVQNWGWYAPKACAFRQTGAGAITFNGTFDVYFFPDGSCRSQNAETWQIVSQTSLARTFDGGGTLTQEETLVRQYYAIEIPRGTANMPFSGAVTCVDVLITTGGTDAVAWATGAEIVCDEYDVATFTASGGLLSSKDMQIQNYNATEYQTFVPSNGVTYGSTLYVFGPTSAPKYGFLAAAAFARTNFSHLATTYTAIDTVSHTETLTFANPGSYYPFTMQKAALIAASGTFTVAGALPFLEVKTSNQQPQPATFTVNDSVRASLALGNTITDYRQNGYCETDTELQTVGIEAMRAIAAPIVAIEMDIDWTIEEGSVIAVVHPRFGYGAVKLLVTDIEWSFSPGTGRNSQRLTCRWYPPELVSLAA